MLTQTLAAASRPTARTKVAKLTTQDLAALAQKMHYPPPTDWHQGRVWVEYDLGYALDAQLQRADIALYEKQKELKHFMEWLGTGNSVDGDDYDSLPVGVKKKRGKSGKKDYKEMEKLLRIIDAKRCNATNKTIADKLNDKNALPIDDSTVSKSYKRALKLWREL